jgi:hypothetical protein
LEWICLSLLGFLDLFVSVIVSVVLIKKKKKRKKKEMKSQEEQLVAHQAQI